MLAHTTLPAGLRLRSAACVALALPRHACGVEVERLISAQVEWGGLHAAEAAHARALRPHRRLAFVGGRLATRRSLRAIGTPSHAVALPVTSDEHGAPALPAGLVGSISHTDGLAAAITSAQPCGRCAVGIDVELASRALRPQLSQRILSADERESQPAQGLDLPGSAELLLRFSVKEVRPRTSHLVPRTLASRFVQPDAGALQGPAPSGAAANPLAQRAGAAARRRGLRRDACCPRATGGHAACRRGVVAAARWVFRDDCDSTRA